MCVRDKHAYIVTFTYMSINTYYIQLLHIKALFIYLFIRINALNKVTPLLSIKFEKRDL